MTLPPSPSVPRRKALVADLTASLAALLAPKLWTGVYFQLRLTDQGLDGRPQAVDLNRISAPPDQPALPPFRPALRDDTAPGARWFNRLTIE